MTPEGFANLGIYQLLFDDSVAGSSVADTLNKERNADLRAHASEIHSLLSRLEAQAIWLKDLNACRTARAIDVHKAKREPLFDKGRGDYSLFGEFNERLGQTELNAFVHHTVPLTFSFARAVDDTTDHEKAWITGQLLLLASKNDLKRLKRCECGCGMWVYFARKIGRWGTETCKQRARNKMPEEKARRNERDRLNYKLDRQRQEKWVRG